MSTREVELTGGAPWGFRMHGGTDQNQPLRISRVNPGRKASLCGIREGDVISSINGRPTKAMTNADAHAMLRSAGPVLKLGLNEDKEMSPRRRSIGKGTELKRPSQLIAEVQKATPQAPVYATIRPSQSPQHRPSSSPMRSSQNSLPSALNSAPLVKSVAGHEEPPKIHPTNPFYTTLPSNYSSASNSKLPVPNGRASFSGVDRTKKENFNDYTDLKSPSFFTKTYDNGPSSLPYLHHNEDVNGYESQTAKPPANDTSDPFSYDKFNQYDNQRLPNNINGKNPFESKRNSDPFEKYLRQENNSNGKSEFGTKNLPGSQSENNFNRREEITKTSTITEHKINEVEEVRTIKKIILNGSGDSSEKPKEHHVFASPIKNKISTHSFEFDTLNKTSEQGHSFSAPVNDTGKSKFEFAYQPQARDGPFSSRNEQSKVHKPMEQKNDYYSSSFDKMEEIRHFNSPISKYHSGNEFRSPTAETPTQPVASKPPVKPESAPAPISSPSKREYYLFLFLTV